jgi:hypothetical protein
MFLSRRDRREAEFRTFQKQWHSPRSSPSCDGSAATVYETINSEAPAPPIRGATSNIMSTVQSARRAAARRGDAHLLRIGETTMTGCQLAE